MKKIISFILALTLLLQGTSFVGLGVGVDVAEASKIYTRQNCTQTNRGKVCKVEKYMKVTTTISKSEVKNLVKQYNSFKKIEKGVKIAQKMIPAVKKIVKKTHADKFIKVMNHSYDKVIKDLQKAANNNKGLKYQYELVMSQNSHSLNKVTNLKGSYY